MTDFNQRVDHTNLDGGVNKFFFSKNVAKVI